MPMLPIKFVTFHCSATLERQNFTAKAINEITVSRFGQSGYHLIVEQGGTYFRFLRDDQLGAHVAKNNSHNIGISYVGGLDNNGQPKDTRTEEQKRSLLTLARTYKARYPGVIFRGHRDWSPDLNNDGIIEKNEWLKSCPCFDVTEWLKAEGII